MSPDTLYVEQGGETHEVTPLGGGQSVGSFYGYDQAEPASADTGLEQSGVSQMFFYEGSGGISLVFLHDEPNDGSGGSASVSFGSAPSELSWVVKDDPFDSGYYSRGAHWDWAPCCTDGGAVRGGLGGEFRMTVSASFSGIDSWVFRDGSGGTFLLDMAETVTLASQEPRLELPDELAIDFELQNPLNRCNYQIPNVLNFGKKDCRTQPGGETPLLLWNEIALTCQELVSFDIENMSVELGDVDLVNAWYGVNPVTNCVWVGFEQGKECARFCMNKPAPAPIGLDDIKDVVDDASQWLNARSANTSQAIITVAVFIGVVLAILSGTAEVAAGVVAVAVALGIINEDEKEEFL